MVKSRFWSVLAFHARKRKKVHIRFLPFHFQQNFLHSFIITIINTTTVIFLLLIIILLLIKEITGNEENRCRSVRVSEDAP